MDITYYLALIFVHGFVGFGISYVSDKCSKGYKWLIAIFLLVLNGVASFKLYS